MRSSTGRWVSGGDFFNRERELRILETRVRDRNHVLLTGQRRMGKTSIARELGQRLEAEGWVFLFADVEGATCAEDAIADIARAVHPVRHIAFRFATSIKRWVSDNINIEEISAYEFRAKFRAVLNAGNWRYQGEQLLRACAEQDKPVLLVIDELPIFLKRVLHGGKWRPADRRVSELVARRASGSWRQLPSPHRIRQHRARTSRKAAWHTRPHQPSLSLSLGAVGP